MRAALLTLWCAAGSAFAAFAQEPDPAQTKPAEVHEHVDVTGTLLTPTRDASGTSWLPETTPMYGMHRPWRGWDVRVNGVASVQFLYEPGDRHRTGGNGNRETSIVNWGMVQARRGAGSGRFGVRAMFSAEPFTVPKCGSLNFLATGEVCDDDTIHDRHQQHDLMMELAVDYDRPLTGNWRWQIYAGIAGEPALGPTGYAHRTSSLANPVGPITHHWLEANTVSFGVVTGALHNQRWKVEGSLFNGREPDNSRVDLDFGALDSYAARLSVLASDRLALQVSAGRLHDANAAFYQQPDTVVTRITASGAYHRELGEGSIWATTAAYGMNDGEESISDEIFNLTTHAALLESSLTIRDRHTVFGRLEVVGMPAHHLHANEFGDAVFAIGKLQGGYVRYFRAGNGIVPGIGGTVALSFLPEALAPRYSGRVAPSIGIFFQIRPARHEM